MSLTSQPSTLEPKTTPWLKRNVRYRPIILDCHTDANVLKHQYAIISHKTSVIELVWCYFWVHWLLCVNMCMDMMDILYRSVLDISRQTFFFGENQLINLLIAWWKKIPKPYFAKNDFLCFLLNLNVSRPVFVESWHQDVTYIVNDTPKWYNRNLIKGRLDFQHLHYRNPTWTRHAYCTTKILCSQQLLMFPSTWLLVWQYKNRTHILVSRRTSMIEECCCNQTWMACFLQIMMHYVGTPLGMGVPLSLPKPDPVSVTNFRHPKIYTVPRHCY